MKKSKNYVALFYVLAVFILIPIYNKGTFSNITGHKIEAFYFVSGLTLILYVIASFIQDFRTKENAKEASDSANSRSGKRTVLGAFGVGIASPHFSMALFGAAVLISTILSGFTKETSSGFSFETVKESIYGVPGFCMGMLTLAIMILSFYYISRYLICRQWIFHVIVAASVIPTIIAIMNRLGLDPLRMFPTGTEPQYSLYVSTFGNYGWYSEYMAVIIPIAIYMFAMSWAKSSGARGPFEKNIENHPGVGKKNVESSLGARRLNFNGVLYGAYLAIAAVAVYMCGTKMLMVTCAAAIAIVLVMKLRKTDSARENGKSGSLQETSTAIFVLVICAYFIAVFLIAGHDDLANGRGYIWQMALDLYKSLPVKDKLFGVGPNRFMYALQDYLSLRPDAAAAFDEHFNGLALTSAHSELLDYLINTGIVGLAAYLYMIYTVAAAFPAPMLERDAKASNVRSEAFRKQKEITFVAATSYFIYSLCNFSIICATPYFFILLGILARKREHDMSENEA